MGVINPCIPTLVVYNPQGNTPCLIIYLICQGATEIILAGDSDSEEMEEEGEEEEEEEGDDR